MMKMGEEYDCDECPLDESGCGLEIEGCMAVHRLITELETKDSLLDIYAKTYRRMTDHAVGLTDCLEEAEGRLKKAEKTLSRVRSVLLAASGKGLELSVRGDKTYVNYESFLRYYHPTCHALSILREHRKHREDGWDGAWIDRVVELKEQPLIKDPFLVFPDPVDRVGIWVNDEFKIWREKYEPMLQEALAITDYVKQIKDWRFVLSTQRAENMRFISNRAFKEFTACEERWKKLSKYTRQTFEKCVDSLDALDRLNAGRDYLTLRIEELARAGDYECETLKMELESVLKVLDVTK